MTNGQNGMWVVQRVLTALAASYGWPDYSEPLDERELPEESVLDGLVGTYRLREGFSLSVVRAGGGLEVTFSRQQPITFLPTDRHTFSTPAADAVLRIQDGRLVLAQNGLEPECARLS